MKIAGYETEINEYKETIQYLVHYHCHKLIITFVTSNILLIKSEKINELNE
jgi:hypothetical protein